MVSEKPSVDSIFLAALELPLDQRPVYLDGVCGDDAALRVRLERLLAAQSQGESFLESPAPELRAADDCLVTEAAGTIIGPYKLLEQIGEGGFGVVFRAEQEKPVRRKVALKVIKPGMDTRAVVNRFEAERQAMAMMDHPNIAKVLDAGTTESGRPYFVMELVQGVPITEYCDQCQLSTRERLELFVIVCQAVQHAHQKSIIHRDLKPTNVLVALQDGQPAPKIIDFGVAKAIGAQPLTERTLTTAFAQMVGTPLYMSPEQAELSPLGVDTRSDIYSLGVLLYELLAGSTPFDKERLHAASYDELRRIIREEEPPRPSARVSTLAADLATTLAERRRTDARRLSQTVRGELDWIVMKCLEKDRNRRYESADSLVRDIERYLGDETVQACPPSVSYRLKKFIRRNKVAVAFVLLLVAAVAALTVSNVQTRRSEARAITENAKARAVSDLLQDMLRYANPDEAKSAEYTVRQLLDDFSASFGAGLPDQPEVEAEIRATIGRAYWRLGASDKAEPHLTKALELRRRQLGPDHELVAESLIDMAWSRAQQGRLTEAEAAARDAQRIYRDRDIRGKAPLKAYSALQHILTSSRRLDEAQAVSNQALALVSAAEYPEIANILHGQAEIYIAQGRFPEAETAARRAVELHRRLHGPSHPETAWGLRALGDTLQKQRKLSQAEEAFREALGIFRERYRDNHFSLTTISGSLKQVLEARGDRSALDALASEELTRSENPDDDVRLADVLLTTTMQAKSDEARRLVRRAMEAYQRVAINYPDDLDRRAKALDGYAIAIGPCVAVPDLSDDVDELNRRLRKGLPQLIAAFPNSSECQWLTAMIHRGWAFELLPYGNDLPTAEYALSESAELLEHLSLSNSKRPDIWLYVFDTYTYLGDVQWRLAKLEDAETTFRRAIDTYSAHAADIASPTPKDALGIALDCVRIAHFLVCDHRDVEAAEFVRKASLVATRLTEPDESIAALFSIAFLQLRLGDSAGYRATCKALVDVSAQNAGDLANAQMIWTWCLAPDSLEDRSILVDRAEEFAAHNSFGQPHVDLYLLGAAIFRDGQYERAASQLEKSITVYPARPLPGLGTINFQRLLLAMTKWRQGRRDEARHLLAEAQHAIDQEFKSPATHFVIRAILEVLRREAEATIGQETAKESPENKNRNNDEPKNPQL